jgi:hypothetical protein
MSYGYFRNMKESAVFMKELVVRKAGFFNFSKKLRTQVLNKNWFF